ncbi:MAG: AAA family ATPase [Planctomycetes bacterium]|nr:AAA family ATPase [Planctomycetota bacterium]
MSDGAIASEVRRIAAAVDRLRAQLGRRILGQPALIDDCLVALVAGGHVLLEGMPGLGKTSLVHALAEGLGLQFARIQFTPDLMPADVTGTRIVDERAGGELTFRFQAGPVFTNLLLADEINRATPKTQSALLEAMQEGSVTVGESTRPLPRPFVVVATQNPIELEGTFPLPEAQLDRFMFQLVVPRPSVDTLVEVLEATTAPRGEALAPVLSAEELLRAQQLAREVLCGRHLLRYVAELIAATDPDLPDAPAPTRRFVRYGASPRAAQAIVLGGKVRALLDGRPSVERDDLARCLLPALRHRVVLTFEAEAEDVRIAELLEGWSAQALERAG